MINTMKLRFLFLFTTLCFGLSVNAQNYKFGKVSKEELSQQSHPKYKEAVAAVLYRESFTKFDYSQEEGFIVKTDYYERIKIYSKEGYEYANKSISLYKSGSADERVSGLKAVTYNLVDGKIKETKLRSSGIFDEKASKTRNIKKFTMPDIQDGAIIEYKYTHTSPFISSIDEFRFQEEIPVEKVEMKFYAPEYLSYRTHGKGSLPFDIKNSSRERSVSYKYYANRRGHASGGERKTRNITFKDIGYAITLNQVAPLLEEPYAGNYENYFSALQFELAFTKYPNTPVRNYTTTWEEVSKKIYKSESFGGELNNHKAYAKDIKTLAAGLTSQAEKALTIYDFVKNKMTWNGYLGVYCDLGVKKAYKEGVGNVADINLMLTGMLNEAGLEASPVLISSKANGIPFFPTLNGFNYVVAGVKIDGHTHLLDAADKEGVIDVLDERLLNWKGRMVKSDGSSRLVDLFPSRIAMHNALVTVNIDEDLMIHGTVQNRYSGHYARAVRTKYNSRSTEEQLKKMDKAYESIDLLDIEFKDMKTYNKPLTAVYHFESEQGVEEIAGKLYISPLLHLGVTENIFKSETRAYPIDFIHPYEDRYSVSINIPDGYKVESIPEDIVINLAQGMGSFRFGTMVNGSKVTLSVQNAIKTPVIDASYYKDLQEYFKMIVDKETEKIVLVKA
ncbi:MAG: DUF3857 domain-containing protein [Dokdonia sp.]|jgi:hypothetical protein